MATAAKGVALTPGARHVVAHAAAVPGEELLRRDGADQYRIDQLRRERLLVVRPQLEDLVRQVKEVRPDLDRAQYLRLSVGLQTLHSVTSSSDCRSFRLNLIPRKRRRK